MNPHLDRLARRVAGDPFFLAFALAGYARSEQLDDPALAAKLDCAVATLTHLRLCRIPRPQAPFFWQDVERIATHFAVSPDVLAEVVRHGQSLMHLQSPGSNRQDESAGFLMAARDNADDATPDPPEGESP
jgi:hypothetical protein